jgi:hypothetical protein
MNREIKFRAWDKGVGRMWNKVSDLGWKNKEAWGEEGLSGAVVTKDEGHNQFRPIEELELMQFTGLTDRNGKEIYESDIVQWQQTVKTQNGEVWWQSARAAFVIDWRGDRIAYGEPDITANREIEVIGNIYENPKLLK